MASSQPPSSHADPLNTLTPQVPRGNQGFRADRQPLGEGLEEMDAHPHGARWLASPQRVQHKTELLSIYAQGRIGASEHVAGCCGLPRRHHCSCQAPSACNQNPDSCSYSSEVSSDDNCGDVSIENACELPPISNPLHIAIRTCATPTHVLNTTGQAAPYTSLQRSARPERSPVS